MASFCTQDGKPTTAENPNRAMWYGQCGFWCDDWDKLTKVGPGIPACPKCKTPGFICTVAQWLDGAARLDRTEPGYLDFLNAHKEKCLREIPGGLTTLWNESKNDLKNRKIIPEGFKGE